jgi:hypothetical protein
VIAVLHLHLVAAALALPLSGVAHNAKGSIAAPDAVVVFCHRPCNHQKLFFFIQWWIPTRSKKSSLIWMEE